MKDKFKDSKSLDNAYISLAKHYDERKENAIRQVKDGAFVDLLNQEQAELQKAIKEKRIEKIENALPHIEVIKAMYGDIDFARYLYDRGCRIIAEDDVVLTKEEYEILQRLYDEIFICQHIPPYNAVKNAKIFFASQKELIDKACKFARKEMAEEFYNLVKEKIEQIEKFYFDNGKIGYNGLTVGELKELARFVGVEIKE